MLRRTTTIRETGIILPRLCAEKKKQEQQGTDVQEEAYKQLRDNYVNRVIENECKAVRGQAEDSLFLTRFDRKDVYLDNGGTKHNTFYFVKNFWNDARTGKEIQLMKFKDFPYRGSARFLAATEFLGQGQTPPNKNLCDSLNSKTQQTWTEHEWNQHFETHVLNEIKSIHTSNFQSLKQAVLAEETLFDRFASLAHEFEFRTHGLRPSQYTSALAETLNFELVKNVQKWASEKNKKCEWKNDVNDMLSNEAPKLRFTPSTLIINDKEVEIPEDIDDRLKKEIQKDQWDFNFILTWVRNEGPANDEKKTEF